MGETHTKPVRLTAAASLISLQEARIIIDEAVAYARNLNHPMAVAVLDQSCRLVSVDRMEDAAFAPARFAQGKAFASVIMRERTETLGALIKDRPDRYFGMMAMYPGKLYLVGGGVPLTVDNVVVGAVGVAGLPQGIDEKAALAGIAAWHKYRENSQKH